MKYTSELIKNKILDYSEKNMHLSIEIYFQIDSTLTLLLQRVWHINYILNYTIEKFIQFVYTSIIWRSIIQSEPVTIFQMYTDKFYNFDYSMEKFYFVYTFAESNMIMYAFYRYKFTYVYVFVNTLN